MMLNNYDKRLKNLVLIDLTNRAFGGTVLYGFIWFSTSIWAQVPQISPVFFLVNSLLIIILFILRIAHYIVLKKHPNYHTDLMSILIVVLVSANALHWGLTSAFIVLDPKFIELRDMYIIISAGFVIGGTSNLAISKEIRLTYPLFILVPVILASIINGASTALLLICICLISLLYSLTTSKVAAKDYWNGVHNVLLAQQRTKQMETLSITDSLTSLKNRQYFNTHYTLEWDRCIRREESMCIMMIDLDNFKHINDTYGHLFGDECLKQVALKLKNILPRKTDTLARFGGEEFIVLLPNTYLPTAIKLAESMISTLNQINLKQQQNTVKLSCSIGLQVMVPKVGEDSNLLIRHADQALCQAKNNGKNQYHVYRSSIPSVLSNLKIV